MKKIHTPISSRIGSQEKMSAGQERRSAPAGRALISTPLSAKVGDQVGILRRIGLEAACRRYSWPVMLSPVMVTDLTSPESTLAGTPNSSTSLVDMRWAWPWNRLNSAKSSNAMTIQTAKLRKLFNFKLLTLEWAVAPSGAILPLA